MTTPPPPGYLGPNPDPRGPQPLQQFPPQGPPPGFAGGPPPPMPRQSAQQRPVAALAALSLISIVAVVVGLTVKEDGRNAWDTVHAWGGLAVLGAVLTLAPAVGRALGLSPHRAAQVAACGAGALVLFWVLFTLPVVG